ncbi:MAG: rod shape-determining protein MreD [Salibacteraceae bacterium]|jgi:rod shape-determining protein MreD
MTGTVIVNILRWLFLMALQIFVLNNIYLGGSFNPYLYVLIILALPIELSALAILSIGFCTGLILDLFGHTLGMHTMALTLLAFMRPKVLALVSPRDGFEFGASVNVRDMGWSKYSVYTLLLIFPYHLLLFMLEGFSSGLFWLAVQKTVLNTLLTFVLILLVQMFSPLKDKS